jgi:hypothetical protein
MYRKERHQGFYKVNQYDELFEYQVKLYTTASGGVGESCQGVILQATFLAIALGFVSVAAISFR